MSSSSAIFLNNESILYDLQHSENTGVLIRLESNDLAENSTLPQLSPDIPNISINNYEAKLFIPGCELHTIPMYACMYN